MNSLLEALQKLQEDVETSDKEYKALKALKDKLDNGYGTMTDPITLDSRGRYEFGIRWWGDWVSDEEDEEDYDWKALSKESGERLDSIVKDISQEFGVKIYTSQGEKCWLYFTCPKVLTEGFKLSIDVIKSELEGLKEPGSSITEEEFDHLAEAIYRVLKQEENELGEPYRSAGDLDLVGLIDSSSDEIHELGYKLYNFDECLNESLLDLIPIEVLDKFTESLIDTKLTHDNYGTGVIKNVELDSDLDPEYSSSWGTMEVEFEDRGRTLALKVPEEYPMVHYSDEALKAFEELRQSLSKGQEQEKELKAQRAIELAYEWAEKHFADGFDIWYRYLTGALKTRPNDLDYDMDKEAYVRRFEELKEKAKRARRIANSFDDVDGTIENTYLGDVKELVSWLKKHITNITISPSRELDAKEGEETIQAILDYVKDSGGTLDKVSIGHSGGAMKNYDMHLDSDALDSCPNLEAFMSWKAPKFDMKTSTEINMPTYDAKVGSISSRKVVLDYLLNRDKYLKD